MHGIARSMHSDHMHDLHQALRIDHDLCEPSNGILNPWYKVKLPLPVQRRLDTLLLECKAEPARHCLDRMHQSHLICTCPP